MKYYCVGFNWNGEDNKNQLPRFIKSGTWENGYSDKFINAVNRIEAGSRIAAKTTYTRKGNDGKTISVLEIHALGTVKKNHLDGRLLDVDWDKDFKPFKLDGKGAYRSTISAVNNSETIKLIFESNPETQITIKSIPLNEDDKYDKHPHNLILYGPPGTGKTYHTITKAISIIDSFRPEKVHNYYEDRNALKDRFDELTITDWDNINGQIAFVTFHQSLSYEDFIEGIKPKILKEQVVYEIEDGIFKRMCNAANEHESNINEALDKFQNDVSELLGNTPKLIESPTTHFYVTYKGTNVLYIQPKATTKDNPWYPVNISNIKKVFDTEDYNGIYNPTYVREIINHLKKDYQLNKKQSKKKNEPYVLIIDEINRGNVSQIFGELITLIETDKRNGNTEKIECTLPYSKEKFSVPDNLYIIGTMNTADRSVEALDTALRRRFVFEETQPKPELLSPQNMLWRFWWEEEEFDWEDEGYVEREEKLHELLGIPEEYNVIGLKKSIWEPMHKDGMKETQIEEFNDWEFNGIDLAKMLEAINYRLSLLLDKDRTIGHAWFMKVRSLQDLHNVFRNSIIPLLQEFFYNDYGKIGLVIGESFFEEVPGKDNPDEVFAKFPKIDIDTKKDLSSKSVFNLKMPKLNDLIEAVKNIYSSKILNNVNENN